MNTHRVNHVGSHSRQILAVVVCASLGACSWIPKGESGMDVGIRDRGIASWYGEQFHGRLAANGEVFDMSALTAAHRTLPLGSMVRVVNLVNGKHVRVRINDRGPYVNGRILDLSYAAADRLGMVEGGVSVIQLEVIGDHRPDFMRSEDDSTPASFSLLKIHKLTKQEMASTAWPMLASTNPTMGAVHRLPPNDVLLQRRWRGLSPFAADPADRDVAALMLS